MEQLPWLGTSKLTRQPLIIRIVYKTPVLLIGLIGFIYAIILVMRFNQDTSIITNSAFAIMATLSALSFSFARAAEEELRDRITFAGERFLHGAIIVLTVSIAKYIIYLAFQSPTIHSAYWKNLLSFPVGIVLAVVFANGILFAHTGLRVLNDLLLMRYTRYSDWDDLV